MRKIISILLLVLLCSLSLWANETPVSSIDSVSVDTIANPDPDWYVAPLTRDSLRAGKRALVASATCAIDSMQIFNEDSVLTGVSIYEYGDTTRTTTWTINSDGSRAGLSKEESGTKGDITFSASYTWDETTNNWKGTSKEEHTFTGNKETLRTLYDWQNGAWSANTQYTWTYDAAGNETEYITYTRNASGELVYAQRREKTYNAAGLMILDIQYGSYTDGAWVGSFKYVYDYNASGTQTLYEYYSSCVNGVWNGSVRNVYDFDAAGNKVLEEKYSGMVDGAWKGSSRYTAVFNAGKEIEHINYKWTAASKSWQENFKYAKTYDGENLTDEASYIWNNGWVGNARTTKTYSGSLVASETVWQWDNTNAVWTNKSKTETQYTGSLITLQTKSVWDGTEWINLSQLSNSYQSNLLAESYTRSWKEGAWQDSLRTINTYDAKNINTLSVSAAWNGAEWISTDSTTREVTYTTISGKDYVQEDITMTWSSKTNQWTGVKRETKEYDAWGNVIQSDTYSYVAGTGWINNVRHLYGYKDGNKNLATLSAYMSWNRTKGVWTGTTKTEKEYDDTNRLKKTSTYKWNTTRNDWEGLASTEDIYENGIKVTSYSYKWDATNWDWTGMFKHDYTYTSSGKIAEQIDWRYDAATGWYYDVKISNTYDAKGRTVKADRFQWIRSESKWCMTSLNETVYDADADGGRLRTEIVATGSNCEITSYARNLYFYDCDQPQLVTITWLNEDGLLIDQTTVEYGATPAHADIDKESTAQYTFTFRGWTPELSPVTGDATYTAVFDTTVNTYTVTWLNSDNSPLDQSVVEYGTTPAHADINKESTAQYTFSFRGWTPELSPVTGDATYTAVFDTTVNTYTVTWLNSDNSLIDQTTVEYGATPAHADINKESTAQYTFTFLGWTPELSPVTGDATYTAVFDTTVNTYTVTWLNSDNSPLDQSVVEYGTTPAHADINKESTAQYTFTFLGWTPELSPVTGDATYTAVFDTMVNTYTITWLNSDNSPLYQEEVAYGETPAYTGETPTQESTAEYTYTFTGWDKPLVAVTGDETYTATFSATRNSYTVTFYFEDGVTVLESQTLEYGETPSTSLIPSKNDEEHYYYTFIGWYPEITPVTGDASYTPVFTKEPKQYTITFNNYNGRQLWTTTVPYGETPVYNGETPTRQRTQQYSYEFAGWSPELATVSGDATYTALFNAIVNQYTVVFQNEDGTELDRQMVDYGTMPEYQGETPTKEPDAEYRYEFAGWTPRIVAVFTDATYTATYTRHDLHEGIDDVQPPCMEAQKVLINGTFYILRGDKVYTTDGVLVE